MKYIQVNALLLMPFFCEAIVTSPGPKRITRNIIQDRKGNILVGWRIFESTRTIFETINRLRINIKENGRVLYLYRTMSLPGTLLLKGHY